MAGHLRRATVVVLLVACACLAIARPAAAAPDCDGPPPEPQPGTAAWDQREADNVFCGGQLASDTSSNPLYSTAATRLQAENGGPVPEDPFRDPATLSGHRFRWERVTVADPAGQPLAGMLFRPCDASCGALPAGLRSHAPPYPGVVIVHGGAASQEMYLWGAEALAEAGYMVLTFQIPEPENAAGDAHYPDARAALDYMLATPQQPARGRFNPHWNELDREHIGLAGHSAGGVAVSRLGQEDPRVGAIVSWDRAQSTAMPADLKLRTPALFLTADFNCQKVPVCLPVAYSTPPDPRGPGTKDEDFQRVSGAGVDSMKVSLRAATHLDFTQFAPTPPSSRYGALVASYYTLAWFDRYLRGDRSLARLTASTFDDSADVHYISGGTFDPVSGRNVPAHIAERPVRDRLSFHFRSAYWLAGGRVRCDDMRAGCPPVTAPRNAALSPRCTRPRFGPRVARVHSGRVRVRPRVVCRGRARSVVVRLRPSRRSVYVVTGRSIRFRVGARLRRVPASFAVDGRRFHAAIALRRAARRHARFAG